MFDVAEIGLFALIISLIFSALLTIMPAIVTQSFKLIRIYAFSQCAFVSFSFLCLALAFYNNDFSVAYVAHHSNTHLPIYYKLAAIWGAHEGSMLLWLLILSSWTAIFCIKLSNQDSDKHVFRYSMMILGALNVAFAWFILQTSNPFLRYLPDSPLEGADLNPLLQDFALIIHPPLLYVGYIGFAIPFALSLGVLLAGTLSESVLILMRRYTLLAWSFLTIGITLGSWWAYYELGWGGWWFWDPVENASLMPWIVGIGLLHCVKITQQKRVLEKWTLLLAIACFSLSLLGIFLVRSGMLSSVHAFASSPLRGAFLAKIGFIFVGAALITYGVRIHKFGSAPASSQSTVLKILSKEGLIWIGSLILALIMSCVLLGTLYPLLVDYFFHKQLSVGPPYFNTVLFPFGMIVLVLMMLAPWFKWLNGLKGLKGTNKRNIIFWMAGIWMVCFLGFTIFFIEAYKLIIGLVLSALLALSIIGLMIKRYHEKSFWKFSFIAMSLAHFGVALIIAGISLTSHLSIEKDLALSVGEKIQVGNYQFYFKKLSEKNGSNYEGLRAEFEIINKDKKISYLYPEKRFYTAREMPISETAIQPGFFQDIYIALGEPVGGEAWSLRIYIKPFVRWLWIGGSIMTMGGFLALFRHKRYYSS